MDRNNFILQNANRMAVMRNLGLIKQGEEEPFFDHITRIASDVIDTPVSLVSMVTATYQFFKSSHGLPEPWQSQRRTPLSHSFCQHVVTSGEPLVIEDARQHDLVKDNKAIEDLNVIGYLGMPIKMGDGLPLGSFCVIDDEPHTWTDDEIAIMQAFSAVVNAEISQRAQAYQKRALDAYITASSPRLDDLEHDLQNLSTPSAIIERLHRLRDEIEATVT